MFILSASAVVTIALTNSIAAEVSRVSISSVTPAAETVIPATTESIVDFNSTFFIFAYLVGLSVIYIYKLSFSHKIRTASLLIIFFASAPVLGFALQIIQNIAYLGWNDMWLDIYGSLTASGNSPHLNLIRRVEASIRPFITMSGLYNFYILMAPLGAQKIKQYFLPSITPISYVLPFLIALAIVAFVKLKKFTGYIMFPLSIPALLLIAPLIQSLLLPLNSIRDYAGPPAAPIIGIIIGSVVWMLYLALAKHRSFSLSRWVLIIFVSAIVLSLFIVQIVINSSSYFGPNHTPLSDSEISFTRAMQKIADGEKAVFMINTVDTQLSEEILKTRFATIDPKEYLINYRNWEYYFDMPLLNFTKTKYLIEDLLFLKKRAKFSFTSIITSDDPNLINELYSKLSLKKLSLTPIKILENRHFFLVEK